MNKAPNTLAQADEPTNRPRPSWENDTTCAADSKQQAAMRASTAADANVRAEADRRANAQKRVHQQDA